MVQRFIESWHSIPLHRAKRRPALRPTYFALLLSVTFVLVASICNPSPTLAQNSPDLVGGIELEEEKKQRKGYAYTQDTVIDYLEQFAKKLEGTNIQSQANLTHPQTNYMASLYLYCSQKLGPCPVVLDTLLEIDVINSKLSGEIACPNLTKFWKVYVATDMERRLELDLDVVLINKMKSFNKTLRNQYIKCKSFVNNIITGGPEDNSKFFSERYSGASKPEVAVKKALAFAKTIKKSNKNLFYITGIKDQG